MRYQKWLLIGIFILALLLRFLSLSTNPPSLNWDEVSHGYNAYSILKTGSDEWGQFLPLANFRAYGDYPLPLYMYLSMPGIAVFGLNEFTVRIPSALFGSLMVLVIYFLVKQIFKNSKMALLAAFLLALSPWDLMISRQVLQATPAILFLALGVWMFLKGTEGRANWIIFGTISLCLSAYAYHNTRILAPVIFLLLAIIYRKLLLGNRKIFLKVLGIAVVFFVPLVFIVTTGVGSARSEWVGILDQGAINRINEARGFNPSVLSYVIHNKITYFASTALLNYLSYFNPQYLAVEGGTQYQYSVPHFGVINPIELPFFYFGLIMLLWKFPKLSWDKKFIVAWLLIAPVPAAISRDPYQVIRSTTMLPVIYLVIAFGVVTFYGLLKNKVWQISTGLLLFLIFVVFFARYFINLWSVYPNQYSFAWQYGYKQVAEYVQIHGGEYSEILITKKYGEPHEFLLFYLKYDPASYKNDPNLVRYEKSNWFWVDRFYKYEFVNDWDMITVLQGRKNVLVITSLGNYPKEGAVLQTINFLDGKPAFDIVKL